LRARVEEYVTVEDDFDASDEYRYLPDVRVLERPGPFEFGGVATLVASTTETFTQPLIVNRQIESETGRSGQIVGTKPGTELSPPSSFSVRSTRVTDANSTFANNSRCWREGVHLVEIDLRRGGPWVLSVPRQAVPSWLPRGQTRSLAVGRKAAQEELAEY
jgi:hypothetical protein